MRRIEKRSNLTRAAQRAPLRVAPPSAAMLAVIERLGTRPSRRVSASAEPPTPTKTAPAPSTIMPLIPPASISSPNPSQARQAVSPNGGQPPETNHLHDTPLAAKAQMPDPPTPSRRAFRAQPAEPPNGQDHPAVRTVDPPPARMVLPRGGNRLFEDTRITNAEPPEYSVRLSRKFHRAPESTSHADETTDRTGNIPQRGSPSRAIAPRAETDQNGPSVDAENVSPAANAAPIKSAEKPIQLPGIFQKNARGSSSASQTEALQGLPARKTPPTMPIQEPMEPLSPIPHPPAPAEQAVIPLFSITEDVVTNKVLLEEAFRQHPSLPAQSLLLGIGDDHLPVLLDLQDAAPGAVVVMGDEREQQIEMLRTAIASLALRNAPRAVQFLVLSCDAPSWQRWVQARGFGRHCLAIENAEADTVSTWVLRLADWTEQRRSGARGGPPIVLVMDTLRFLMRLPEDVRLNFDWMAKEGPQAGIWPVAAISTELARVLQDRHMLNAFPMRIFGYTADASNYVKIAGMEASAASTFGKPGQFAVALGKEWLRFGVLDSTSSR